MIKYGNTNSTKQLNIEKSIDFIHSKKNDISITSPNNLMTNDFYPKFYDELIGDDYLIPTPKSM